MLKNQKKLYLNFKRLSVEAPTDILRAKAKKWAEQILAASPKVEEKAAPEETKKEEVKPKSKPREK